MAEAVAVAIEGKDAFRRELAQVRRREIVEALPGCRKLLSRGHQVTERPHDFHPVIRRGRDSPRDRLPFHIPVPVEKLCCRTKRGRARGIEVGVEQKGEVLRQAQQRHLATPEPRRIESCPRENGLHLVDRELADADLRGRFRYEPPQA